MSLEGSATHQNLCEAFARESQAHHRYLWFAEQADVEGYPKVASLFRSVAEGESGHALGILEYLAEQADPATGLPIGDTVDNLRAAFESETRDATSTYPSFAATARNEGFVEIAEWFELLSRSEAKNVEKFGAGLSGL